MFLTAALYKLYKLNDTLVFVISAFVGAGFEYFCSWLQEQMFGTVSWDYSDTPFNLDGRTNLMYALIWGFLGLVWVRYLYPWTAKLIEKSLKSRCNYYNISDCIHGIQRLYVRNSYGKMDSENRGSACVKQL